MTKARYEWCKRKDDEEFKEPSPSLSKPMPRPSLAAGHRILHTWVRVRGKWVQKPGTGSKKPYVRCPRCGTRVKPRTRNNEPAASIPELVWVLPPHKYRVK